MKYCSIDIETSGLDPENNKILSIGAIIEDTKLKQEFCDIPKFNAIVLQREICGSPRALTMNNDIIKLMGDYLESNNDDKTLILLKSPYMFLEEGEVAKEFHKFLMKNYVSPLSSDSTLPYVLLNVAGKNFGSFDLQFLKRLPWWQKLIRVKQRIIDPAILCCKWDEDDALPGLNTCKERMNIKGEVTHTAIDDAWDVVTILRKFY